ncbi:MAG: phasin family protein [Hyphomicrobiales bacterium]|nr:phasin family protein [Hyphomicrobiales bacterium]
MSGFEEYQKASQDCLNKTLESFGTCSKGLQAIAVEAADYSKKSFEAGAAHVEAMAGVKSLDKAIEAQNKFVKTAYEGGVAEATKLGELYVDLAKDLAKPFEAFMPKVAK